jgi:hypothetical protein
MLSPGVTVVGVALVASILVEFVQWLLVFRTEKFKTLKQRITLAEKKLEVCLSSFRGLAYTYAISFISHMLDTKPQLPDALILPQPLHPLILNSLDLTRALKAASWKVFIPW